MLKTYKTMIAVAGNINIKRTLMNIDAEGKIKFVIATVNVAAVKSVNR